MIALFIRRILAALLFVSSSGNAVSAQEASEYQYDSIGRLKSVSRNYPGGSSAVRYSHDKADSRSSITYSKSEAGCRVTPEDYWFNIGGATGTFEAGRGVWIGLTGYCSGPITIAYASQDGTAVAGVDYAPVSSQVVIDPASASSGYYNIGWARRGESNKQYFVNFTIVSGDAVLAKSKTTIGINLD